VVRGALLVDFSGSSGTEKHCGGTRYDRSDLARWGALRCGSRTGRDLGLLATSPTGLAASRTLADYDAAEAANPARRRLWRAQHCRSVPAFE